MPILIGGGMKLAGLQLPVIDHPLGAPMRALQVGGVQPDLDLP